MLVRCPSCKTTYKVSDELLKAPTPAFRCSRCKHTFELEPPEPSMKPSRKVPPSEIRSSGGEEEKELSFTFPQTNENANLHEREPKEFVVTSVDNAQVPPPGNETGEPWSMSANAATPETAFTISAAQQEPADERIMDPVEKRAAQTQAEPPIPPTQENAANVLALDSHRDQQVSTAPYLTLFAILTIIFSLATAFHEVYPKATEGFVKKIPLVGAAVVKNNHLKSGVALQSIRSGYHTIQGNREVFAITGVALNQNSAVIREVRVGGQIYNQEGKEIEQQTMWVGNAISIKLIRGMTLQDILDLQRLKPLKTFEIPPGDSVPFTIVFLKPAKGIKEFICEVLSAEGEA